MSNLKSVNNCPINTALNYLGKKWTFQIVRDLFKGKKRFKEFIESNNGLKGKVLSERLSELREQGIIEKKVSNTFPVKIEYNLTEKGKALNRIIYELAVFAVKHCEEYEGQWKEYACPVNGLERLRKALKVM